MRVLTVLVWTPTICATSSTDLWWCRRGRPRFATRNLVRHACNSAPRSFLLQAVSGLSAVSSTAAASSSLDIHAGAAASFLVVGNRQQQGPRPWISTENSWRRPAEKRLADDVFGQRLVAGQAQGEAVDPHLRA